VTTSQAALEAWLGAVGRGEVAACEAAARAVAGDPWRVVEEAGALARAAPAVAGERLGVSARLTAVSPESPGCLAVIEPGGIWPRHSRGGRRAAGAYDTPRALAREVVRQALRCAPGARQGLDPACGPGAFLVALQEAGLEEVRGLELDPRAAAVARVAAPGARIEVGDALAASLGAEVVVGNPPFVPPERQDKDSRRALSDRLPWLSGRYDLSVPFAALAVEGARRAAGLVLPAALLSQPYGAPLRRAWLARHRVAWLERRETFPQAQVPVALIALAVGEGPAPVAPAGVDAGALLSLERAPLDPALRPGDVALALAVRAASAALGDLCEVDTGVVAHGPLGGKARLLRDAEEPGARPYVDARDFFSGRRRWIHYRPGEMHRPKRLSLFEGEKILIQRLRGGQPVRAAVDRSGAIPGHTLTVAAALPGVDAPLERLVEALTCPALAGVIRVEQGARLDLYPRDVRGWPIPRRWLADPQVGLAEACGLDPARWERLTKLGKGG
jgi:hypothetical protein